MVKISIGKIFNHMYSLYNTIKQNNWTVGELTIMVQLWKIIF